MSNYPKINTNMLKAVKIRLYPNKTQQSYINQLLGCYRLVYNKCLDKKKTAYMTDKWFPSSKLCSVCRYKNVDLTLSDRKWTCPECGTHHDRDFNASQNIKKEGQKIIGSRSPEFTLVDNHNTDWMKQEEKLTQV